MDILPACIRAAGLWSPVSIYTCYCNITTIIVGDILFHSVPVPTNCECKDGLMLWSGRFMKHPAGLDTTQFTTNVINPHVEVAWSPNDVYNHDKEWQIVFKKYVADIFSQAATVRRAVSRSQKQKNLFKSQVIGFYIQSQ